MFFFFFFLIYKKVKVNLNNVPKVWCCHCIYKTQALFFISLQNFNRERESNHSLWSSYWFVCSLAITRRRRRRRRRRRKCLLSQISSTSTSPTPPRRLLQSIYGQFPQFPSLLSFILLPFHNPLFLSRVFRWFFCCDSVDEARNASLVSCKFRFSFFTCFCSFVLFVYWERFGKMDWSWEVVLFEFRNWDWGNFADDCVCSVYCLLKSWLWDFSFLCSFEFVLFFLNELYVLKLFFDDCVMFCICSVF